MRKITMIAVQDGAYWIRPDQIEHIEPTYEGTDLTELEVYLLSGEHYTLDDREDIQKVMSFINVLPDKDIPF